MTKHVYITVTGSSRNQDPQPHNGNQLWENGESIATSGEFYQCKDGFYVLYEEPADSNCQRQKPGTKNRIHLRSCVLELTKKGQINARMVLEPGRRHRTDYVTPWGTLLLETDTRRLDVNRSEEKIHIEAEYTLSAEGVAVSTRNISIIIQNCIQSG